MSQRKSSKITHVLHPWHGVHPGQAAPNQVTVYVEMVPTDVVKYEVDKVSGLLKLDRPQKYSSVCPALYGFIPQTYCGDQVGLYAAQRAGRQSAVGDADPLDICVLSERPINHGGLLVTAVPIGGFRMFDGDEADDKIIGVLMSDPAYGGFADISDCPASLVDRLRHYFLTYKDMPASRGRKVEIPHVYGATEAREIIRLSMQDYQELYGDDD